MIYICHKFTVTGGKNFGKILIKIRKSLWRGFPMTFFLQTQVLMHVDRKSDLMAVHTCGPVLSFTLPSPCTTSSQAFPVNAFW